MLTTRFPRPVGDIGNPETFPFPVTYRRVESATVARVVTADGIDETLIGDLEDAARDLASSGVDLIATGCGFLAPVESRLQAASGIPVLASALNLLPGLRRRYGRAPLGVLTFDSRRLGRHHFGPAWNDGLIVEGIESGGELYRVIDGDLPDLDIDRARRDAVSAAQRVVVRAPDISAIVLECTNLGPYRDDIAAAARRPVHDLAGAIIDRAG